MLFHIPEALGEDAGANNFNPGFRRDLLPTLSVKRMVAFPYSVNIALGKSMVGGPLTNDDREDH